MKDKCDKIIKMFDSVIKRKKTFEIQGSSEALYFRGERAQ